MSLINKAIPQVSKEFALDLQKRFKPYDVRPGFDRDELMQSVGEQRVIKFILHHCHKSSIQSDLEIKKDEEEEETEVEEYKPSWFEMFMGRFYN